MANAAAGELLEARGERARAVEHLERALATNPEHLRALWNLARIELDRGDVERARERCEQVLEIAADEGGAHWVLGLIAEREERHADALARFELAVRFDPTADAFAAALARARERASAR
jgi:tetratricopeptide (TPR) repeat protein